MTSSSSFNLRRPLSGPHNAVSGRHKVWSQEELAAAADVSIPKIKRLKAHDGPWAAGTRREQDTLSAILPDKW